MNRRSLLLLAPLSLGLIAGGSWLSLRGGDAGGQSQIPGAALADTPAADAEILPDMAMGSADAPITLIEYASFTCPHCAHFHDTVFGELKKNYIDTGKVRFIHREVYFDKYGIWAGMVAQCGGPMRYFGIADVIYSTQKDWAQGDDAQISGNLRKIGLKAGLTQEQLDACMNDSAHAQAMVATYQKNAGADGVNATPTLFINGEQHSNMSYEDLAKILDAKLAQ